MKPGLPFEPHLAVNQIKLPPSAEWTPSFRSWSFIQIRSGISYWQQLTATRELPEGTALILAGEPRGGLRASQLGEVNLAYYCIEPEKLAGLLSLGEQQSLQQAALRDRPSVRFLAPSHPIAERFCSLGTSGSAGVSTRLQLLQLFMDWFHAEYGRDTSTPAIEMDSRSRLRQFLDQTAALEFLELSPAELAPKLRCSPRHLRRLFRKEVGASFREKQTELRLTRACELLANSNAKIVEVALTSGYQSNSLFSLLFKKRYGLSPAKWRAQQIRRIPRRQKFVRMLPV